MNRERRFILWSLVALFAIIAILFVWNRWHQAATHFLSGTQPSLPIANGPAPTLPPMHVTDPARGSTAQDAVVIVEFGDFACPTCRQIEPELKQALAQSPYPVRLIWRDFPVLTSGDPTPTVTAIAGRCAQAQGKFWELHDAMFASGDLSWNALLQLAQAVQLNTTTFKQCLTYSTAILQTIGNDLQDARDHHIDSAPTFFIGHDVLTGFHTAGDFTVAISRAYHRP